MIIEELFPISGTFKTEEGKDILQLRLTEKSKLRHMN